MFVSPKQPIRPARAGFSLVELLVVISIVAVLLAVLLPSLSKARQAALAARCGSQLRQSGISFMRYAYDYKEWGPHRIYSDANAFTGAWINDYLPNTQVLRCPTDSIRPSTQGAIGGLLLNDDNQVLSSYFHLFGAGHFLGTLSTTDDSDHFFGWRVLSGAYCGLPNLRFMGRPTTYTNKNFGLTRTKTLLNPDSQAIAVDGYRATASYFNGAVPTSNNYDTASVANNMRNNMHPDYDGLNVQFADGHVSNRKRSEVIFRFETGSGLTTSIYW